MSEPLTREEREWIIGRKNIDMVTWQDVERLNATVRRLEEALREARSKVGEALELTASKRPLWEVRSIIDAALDPEAP